MLPDVDADDDGRANDGVLVFGLSERKLAVLGDEPAPAGTLDGSGGGVELSLELLERAKVAVDGLTVRSTDLLSRLIQSTKSMDSREGRARLELGLVRASRSQVEPLSVTDQLPELENDI